MRECLYYLGHWIWYGGWPKPWAVYGDTYIARDPSFAISRYKKTWRYRLGQRLCRASLAGEEK